MKQESFSIRARLKSFSYAIQGIRAFLYTEHNAWLHLLATGMVMVMAAWIGVSRLEWIALVLVTGLVWVAEIFNTCFEKAMDFISPARHPSIKLIKDLAAGGVLVAALVAGVTGAVIFIPKIFHI